MPAQVRQGRLTVSLDTYQHLTMRFTLTCDQLPITDFLDEVTQQQLIIRRLLADNKTFRDLLSQQKALEKVSRPNFLQELFDEHLKRTQRKKSAYGESFKKSCTALRILMGRSAYKIFQANVVSPSLATLNRTMNRGFAVKEGELVVEQTLRCLEANGEPLFAWLSEDDTKVQERRRYNSLDDTIIGLELPLDGDGMPQTGYFKFTSLAAASEYLRKYPTSSYLKLVTVTSLSPNARSYNVLFSRLLPLQVGR